MKLIDRSVKASAVVVLGAWFALTSARAVDFHVATAQALQNALTTAAGNSTDNVIYLGAGYYTGNFNYSSTGTNNLTLQGEAGTTNADITIDGAGTGRSMSLSSLVNLTVSGITFLRNNASDSNSALRMATPGRRS